MTHTQRRPGRLFLASAAPLVLAGLLTGSGAALAGTAPAAGSAAPAASDTAVAAVGSVPAASGPASATTATAATKAATPTGHAKAACPGWAVMRVAGPGAMTDDFFGVAVLSPSNVWAVGDYSGLDGVFKTLVEHWNGHTWRVVPTPSPGAGSDYLSSVHAVSPASIWAVGDYSDQAGVFAPDKTLILHWNGRTWSRVPSPSPGRFIDSLNGVHTLSATNAWAVGFYTTSGGAPDRNLILHWNGRAWSQVASSNPGSKADVLNGVQGIAASNVWAVGLYENGLFGLSLALHWNGHGWTKVATPNPTGSSELLGVDATSAANAWAVGDDGKGESVTLRWNGRTWTRVPSPDILRGDDNILHSVAATSPTNAWAVGAANNLSTGTAFELHWNGRKWTNMASPNPGANSSMDAVAATSASNAWAVGEYGLNPPATTQRALAFHCT